MSEEQVSQWLTRLQQGDQRAAEVIWSEYFEKIVRLARRRLGELPRRVVDEEDVALSAMNSLFRGAEAGRFPRLEDRDDLWKLLVTITARKAIKQQRRHFADKRGGGLVQGESVLNRRGDGAERWGGIDQVLGREPTPELAEMISETCRTMLSGLDDETLEQIAQLKLEGYTNPEIAAQLKCSKRTVERKLERIKERWSLPGADEDEV
jgi:RNA polymerase sigma factor (sigma-70 family)